MKNPSAVELGQRSAKARLKKLGKKKFSQSMREVALSRYKTAHDKAKDIHKSIS